MSKPVVVTRAQVRAAQVVADLLAARGEAVPLSVYKIAHAKPTRLPLSDLQRTAIASIHRSYREKRGDR